MDAVMMQIGLPDVALTAISFILGICLAVIIYQIVSRTKAKTFEHDLERQIEGTKKEAENIIKSAHIDAATEAIKKKEKFTTEVNQIRAELRETETRLSKHEDALDRQAEQIQQREKGLKQKEKETDRRLHNIGLKEKQLSVLMAQQKNQLLKITAMDIGEAKELHLKRLEHECEHEMASIIQSKVN